MAGSRHEPLAVWRRIRGVLPYLLAAGLFTLGLYALHRLLAPVHPHDIAAEIRAIPWSVLALAGASVLCGYLALAGYDWSALRYIGKPLPVPVVLTGGMMAYPGDGDHRPDAPRGRGAGRDDGFPVHRADAAAEG